MGIAKRKRIKGGSKEKMRKPGAKGAPTAAAFRASAKTHASDRLAASLASALRSCTRASAFPWPPKFAVADRRVRSREQKP